MTLTTHHLAFSATAVTPLELDDRRANPTWQPANLFTSNPTGLGGNEPMPCVTSAARNEYNDASAASDNGNDDVAGEFTYSPATNPTTRTWCPTTETTM